MIRAHVRVHGRVQGVFFRVSAQRKAEELGLHGWVRNRGDGTVELVAEGPESAVERFMDWCHQGPDLAEVDRVDVFTHQPAGLPDVFEIRPNMP